MYKLYIMKKRILKIIVIFIAIFLSNFVSAINDPIETDLVYCYKTGDYFAAIVNQTLNSNITFYDGYDLESNYVNESDYYNIILYLNQTSKSENQFNLTYSLYANNTSNPNYNNLNDFDFQSDLERTITKTESGIFEGFPIVPKDIFVYDLINDDLFYNLRYASFISEGILDLWDPLMEEAEILNSNETYSFETSYLEDKYTGEYFFSDNYFGILNVSADPQPIQIGLQHKTNFRIKFNMGFSHIMRNYEIELHTEGGIFNITIPDENLINVNMNYTNSFELKFDSTGKANLDPILLQMIIGSGSIVISIIIGSIGYYIFMKKKILNKWR